MQLVTEFWRYICHHLLQTPAFKVGVANGTSKILGLVNFSCDLEISTVFAKSLEVSFIVNSHIYALDWTRLTRFGETELIRQKKRVSGNRKIFLETFGLRCNF